MKKLAWYSDMWNERQRLKNNAIVSRIGCGRVGDEVWSGLVRQQMVAWGERPLEANNMAITVV